MVVGGIVLCGGASRRMGRSKVTLPFGGEPMLCRVVRLVGEAVGPRVAVVAAPAQQLPPLPADVQVVRDRAGGRGPLEGLFCGLTALRSQVDAAYVTGCDFPLLRPAFVHRLVRLLDDYDAVVPVEGDLHHPLAAVYCTRLVDTIAGLLEQDERQMAACYDHVTTRRVNADELRDVDPGLRTLLNVNQPEDYARALREAGLLP